MFVRIVVVVVGGVEVHGVGLDFEGIYGDSGISDGITGHWAPLGLSGVCSVQLEGPTR